MAKSKSVDKPKPRVGSDLRVRVYPVLERAVEDGVNYGYNHFFKHRDDAPTESMASDHTAEIVQAVLNELCEALVWDDSDEG